MNKTKKAYLLGLGLGDGCYAVNKARHNSVNFNLAHCDKQLDYFLWKRNLITSLVGGKLPSIQKYSNSRSYGEKYSKEYWRYCFSKSNSDFRFIRSLLYQDNKKTFTRNMLNQLTIESIAIWWMDDGSLSVHNKNPITGKPKSWALLLNTYLSKEENQIIIDYFYEAWGVRWRLNKSKGLYRLRMGTIEGRKFLDLIRTFILKNVPSMSYKVKFI